MSAKLSRHEFIKRCTFSAGSLLLPAVAGTSPLAAIPSTFPFPDAAIPPSSGICRGSWVQKNKKEAGDLVLADNGQGCVLVVSPQAPTTVQQAARFLAADIEKISAYLPPILSSPVSGKVNIHLVTYGADAIPPGIADEQWVSQPESNREAHRILTTDHDVWLAGADFRGTAFAAYTLSERLGIDPLYWWTGYQPEEHKQLILRKTDHRVPPPVFRYRGFFHDDEDILQRPFEANGYPWRFGDIDLEWYQRYFETALRLRLNMVAPYTRAHRRKEVQQTASDWGLYYTSHHYDLLLSNPFGIERFNLAEKRKVDPSWDWFSNRKGMTDYWKGGVDENRELYAIWPIGLRGTDDHAYAFPADTSTAAQAATFREVLDTQVKLVEQALPKDHVPLFHFTLYTEMLEQYQHNRESFNVPENVIIIWPDDNNGLMRQLPEDKGKWKHGIYYHLAYFGNNESKQSFHTVSPQRIAKEFSKIITAGATEFMLLNTTELREFVMEARMIARLCWEGQQMPGTNDRANDPANDYIRWWCREYFGQDVDAVANVYRSYYDLYTDAPSTWSGSDKVQEMLDLLAKRFNRRLNVPAILSPQKEWASQQSRFETAVALADQTSRNLPLPAQQFLFEQLTLGLLFGACTLQSATLLARALAAPDEKETWDLITKAMAPLEKLELAILKAERPPFEKWYRETWIRSEDSPLNLHRPYNQLRAFIAHNGKVSPVHPPVKQGHNIPQAKKWTRFLEETNQSE